jgi:ATP-binding cassette subfamily B protein/ATP-binding cassette subfamily C protein LapB
MSDLSFEQALRALLVANGSTADDSAPLATPQSAAEYVEARGLRIRQVKLLYPILPEHPMQIGCIVAYHDGGFSPLLGKGIESVLLQLDGTLLRQVADGDLENAASAWVLSEPVITAKRALPYIRRHRGKLLEILACGVLVNLFGLSLPLFSSFVYDKIIGNGITATLWALVIGLMLIVLVEFSIRAIRILIAERIGRLSEAEIDHATFRNLLNLEANALPSIGSVMEKYKQLLYYRDFLSSSYLLALADLPFLILFALTIMLVSGPLVFVGIACGVLMVATHAVMMLPVFDYEKQSHRANERRMGLMADVLIARDALVGAFLRNALTQKWRVASMGATHASSMARFWRGMAQTISNSLSFVSYAGVLIGGVYMIEDQLLTAGGLLAASMLTARMMGTFASLSMLMVRYREFSDAIGELNKILPVSAYEKPTASHGILRGAVRLDGVTCRVGHGGNPVLREVSLRIGAGEMVGIAGAPGSGKTTLLRLIAGLLTPDEGNILIDDIPIRDLSLEDISRTIGLKPQDLCLIDGTIEENIRAGGAAFSAAERQELLVLSGLVQSFQESGLSWKTDIGPRGSHLSGGQRQMVAIARALAGNPPLLLLDEPTNGLDATMEMHFADQLQRYKGHATIIVSTHSRSLLSLCDRIIVIGQSRILADGPREKVLMNN